MAEFKKLADMTEEEAEAYVESKQCPACGKDCVLRKGGWRGWFRGCPDFPSCSGKADGKNVTVQQEDEEEYVRKVRQAMHFIREMGGTKEAQRWLNIACGMINPAKDEPKKTPY